MSSLVSLEGQSLSKGSCPSCAETAGAMCLWGEYCRRKDYCGQSTTAPPRATEHSWLSSLHTLSQNSPRWRSPRHTLPNRPTKSRCNRLILFWSCRKRTVSMGGATPERVSTRHGCRVYWAAATSTRLACLIPTKNFLRGGNWEAGSVG